MRIKLMEFNVQDFFLELTEALKPADLARLDEPEWQLLARRDTELKPLAKLQGIARVFAHEKPDVAMLCEVGGLEALSNFNRLFLADGYDVYLVTGNSDRNIHNGYLVRKGFPWRAELHSHREWPVPFSYPFEDDPAAWPERARAATAANIGLPAGRKLSRDIPELRLIRPDGQVGLVLLNAHLKSAYDPHGIDPGGNVRRAAEALALFAIREAAQTACGGAPVVIAGDLNGNAARQNTDAELAALYTRTDLEDVLEISGRAPYDRLTYVGFWRADDKASQLDYILVPRALHGRIVRDATYVHRFKDPIDGKEIQMPGSAYERNLLPSDHYPVICVLDL